METLDFIMDCQIKQNISGSARHRRGHCGRGGAVRLPSDGLSRGEVSARNGRCRVYRMNVPLDFGGLGRLPWDLRRQYIRQLRIRYGAADGAICAMLGVSPGEFSRLLGELELPAMDRNPGFDPGAWTQFLENPSRKGV